MGNRPERDDNDGVSSLDDLDSRLKWARGVRPDDPHPQAPQGGLGTALRLAAEMISALIVGGAIGWFLDRWLDTKPWLLLVFLLLGALAGMLNAYRAAMRLSAEPDSTPRDD